MRRERPNATSRKVTAWHEADQLEPGWPAPGGLGALGAQLLARRREWLPHLPAYQTP